MYHKIFSSDRAGSASIRTASTCPNVQMFSSAVLSVHPVLVSRALNLRDRVDTSRAITHPLSTNNNTISNAIDLVLKLNRQICIPASKAILRAWATGMVDSTKTRTQKYMSMSAARDRFWGAARMKENSALKIARPVIDAVGYV